MKLLVRTLLLCAATSFSLAVPALADEQVGAVSYDASSDQFSLGDMLTERDLLAVLPADALTAMPGAPMPGSGEAVGAEGPGGQEHGGPGGREPWKGHHPGPLSGVNALTDEQYEKLYALRNAFLNTVGPKMSEIGRLHRELKDSLLASDIDSKRVGDLSSRLMALRSEVAQAKMNRLIASAQVLTADQRHALHSDMIRHSATAGLLDDHHGGHSHHHH
jgi:Spy/CpxP family protein refolding chaperone